MTQGAMIERGIVADVTEDGYTVASFDRDGLVTPPIAATDGTVYAQADLVYFCLFPDGTGRILCRIY